MTTHTIMSFDSHQTQYNDQTYVHTTYSSTTNQSYYPYLTTFPISSIKPCENLLYGTKLIEDVGSATSSTAFVCRTDNYDNAYSHTYDNPIECFENYDIKQTLLSFPLDDHENVYDNTLNEFVDHDEKPRSSTMSTSTSQVFFYFENKSLALSACIISVLLLLIVSLAAFLLYKFIRPVIVTTTTNTHYDMMNISNTSTTLAASRLINSPIFNMRLTQSLGDTSALTTAAVTTSERLSRPALWCPPERWGLGCQKVCKPCGLGICHPLTGNCICPTGIYGQFCDLWKIEDKPRRGDMMS